MRGRARGHQERAIILAHQIEVMHRQKTVRDIKHYLPKANPTPPVSGTSAMLAMVRRFKQRQDGGASANP